MMSVRANVVALALVGLGACMSGCANTPQTNVDPALQAKYDTAARNAGIVSSLFEQSVALGGDPVQTLIRTLESDAVVQKAELSIDGTTVLVTLVDGTQFAIPTDEKSRPEWQEVPAQTTARTAKTLAAAGLVNAADTPSDSIICDPSLFPKSKEACLVMNFSAEFGQNTSRLEPALTRAGYHVNIITLKTPADIERLQQALPTCGVLYLSSHGFVGKDLNGKYGNMIATEIEVGIGDNGAPTSLFDMVGVFGENLQSQTSVVGHKGKAYWALTPAFFDQFTYPNSLVFMDACNSAHPIDTNQGDQLSDTFALNGAGVFVGHDGPISTQFSNGAADEFFEGLSPKLANIQGVAVTTNPPDPGGGESYVPSAMVTPAQADVEVRLSISGTDGFAYSDTGKTDAGGMYTFRSVPGGASGVEDTLTAVAGGADNSATVVNTIKKNPGLARLYKLPWESQPAGLSHLVLHANDDRFNLVCNNQTLTKTTKIVKF